MYSDKKYRHHQYTVTTNWPGGIYGYFLSTVDNIFCDNIYYFNSRSPTVSGSRAGSTIACTWACLLFHGLEGYVESTKSIIDTARFIESKLRKIKGIYIFGTPGEIITIGRMAKVEFL